MRFYWNELKFFGTNRRLKVSVTPICNWGDFN